MKPALAALEATESGLLYVGRRNDPIPPRYRDPALQSRLWTATQEILDSL